VRCEARGLPKKREGTGMIALRFQFDRPRVNILRASRCRLLRVNTSVRQQKRRDGNRQEAKCHLSRRPPVVGRRSSLFVRRAYERRTTNQRRTTNDERRRPRRVSAAHLQVPLARLLHHVVRRTPGQSKDRPGRVLAPRRHERAAIDDEEVLHVMGLAEAIGD
jgi:hypothetical protein